MNEDNKTVNEGEIQLLKDSVKYYANFPKEGVTFCDIFSILINPTLTDNLFNNSVRAINDFCKKNNKVITTVMGFESRGFILGTAIADRLKLSFVPLRKKNKLPGETIKVSYKTEYSEDVLELQKDALKPGNKVLLVDDLIATGGTIGAAEKALEHIDGVETVGYFCVFEVGIIKGRNNLKNPDNLITLITV